MIGSQQVPYIFEDRIAESDVLEALEKMYDMKKEDREKLGEEGRAHVNKNYSFEGYQKKWVEVLDDVHERHGSWEDRKNYSPWTLSKIN